MTYRNLIVNPNQAGILRFGSGDAMFDAAQFFESQPLPSGRGVPNFLFPESCAAVLARAADRREWLSRPLGEARTTPT